MTGRGNNSARAKHDFPALIIARRGKGNNMEELRFNDTGAEFVIDTDQKAAWAVGKINERREQA